jgi:hypothetical protein
MNVIYENLSSRTPRQKRALVLQEKKKVRKMLINTPTNAQLILFYND